MSEKYIFFWQAKENSNEITKACLSQWYISSFKVDNIKYFCAEQYMMSQKALLFNDLDTYNKIMNSQHQNECKKLGREIKNFDHEKWDKNKFDIVTTGNIHKFQQNEQLKNYLLSTNKKILVEASPYDKIWGIGMAETDKNILDESKWKGSNLLGKALMKVRDILNQDILYQEKKIPKIICMMITSFDGRAKGKYLFDQGIVRQGLINFFIEFHRIPHQGDIYGSHTMKEAYCKGEVDLTKYKNNNIIIPKEDWISPNKNLDYYIFTFDRKGDINYNLSTKSINSSLSILSLKTNFQFFFGIFGIFNLTFPFGFILVIFSLVGVPKILIISNNCSLADFPGKRGLFKTNSAMTHPIDQTST